MRGVHLFPMAERSFGVLYDGPALDTGEIAVRDLAPALLSLGELFTEASVAMFPSRRPVSLNIKATGDGSFWISLHLVADGWEDLIDIWSSKTATALADMSAAVYSLFQLIKWARGRPVEAQPDPPEPGIVRITAPDGTTMDIPTEAWLLFQRQSARRKAHDVVKPLEEDGIDRLEFRPARKEPADLVIEEDDVPAFDVPPETPEALTENERDTLVEIVTLSYEANKRWRLREGAAAFNAVIEDAKFWEGVHGREFAFAEGDMLRVRLRVIQSFSIGGRLQADHRVQEVYDVVRPEDLQP